MRKFGNRAAILASPTSVVTANLQSVEGKMSSLSVSTKRNASEFSISNHMVCVGEFRTWGSRACLFAYCSARSQPAFQLVSVVGSYSTCSSKWTVVNPLMCLSCLSGLCISFHPSSNKASLMASSPGTEFRHVLTVADAISRPG